MWKMVNGKPFKETLVHCKIPVDPQCIDCNIVKTIPHAFFDYATVKDVWKKASPWECIKLCQLEVVKEVVLRLFLEGH